jgi:hypothetical protein
MANQCPITNHCRLSFWFCSDRLFMDQRYPTSMISHEFDSNYMQYLSENRYVWFLSQDRTNPHETSEISATWFRYRHSNYDWFISIIQTDSYTEFRLISTLESMNILCWGFERGTQGEWCHAHIWNPDLVILLHARSSGQHDETVGFSILSALKENFNLFISQALSENWLIRGGRASHEESIHDGRPSKPTWLSNLVSPDMRSSSSDRASKGVTTVRTVNGDSQQLMVEYFCSGAWCWVTFHNRKLKSLLERAGTSNTRILPAQRSQFLIILERGWCVWLFCSWKVWIVEWIHRKFVDCRGQGREIASGCILNDVLHKTGRCLFVDNEQNRSENERIPKFAQKGDFLTCSCIFGHFTYPWSSDHEPPSRNCKQAGIIHRYGQLSFACVYMRDFLIKRNF